jgi:hypothetical protein
MVTLEEVLEEWRMRKGPLLVRVPSPHAKR